jgi:hypothetical protein
MRTLKVETREVYVPDIVHCNQCGNEISPQDKACGNFLPVSHSGGYGSVLGDGDDWSFDLCEPCLKVIMDGFKIRPTVNNEP